MSNCCFLFNFKKEISEESEMSKKKNSEKRFISVAFAKSGLLLKQNHKKKVLLLFLTKSKRCFWTKTKPIWSKVDFSASLLQTHANHLWSGSKQSMAHWFFGLETHFVVTLFFSEKRANEMMKPCSVFFGSEQVEQNSFCTSKTAKQTP